MGHEFNILACVLAGGKSQRMGKDKALTELNGQPLISQVISALEPVVHKIEIVGQPKLYSNLGLTVHKDIIADKGPMGGILTALNHTKADEVMILSCDIPFIRSNSLRALLECYYENKPLALVARNGDRIHPLVGVYSKSLLPKLEENISNNKLKMLEFLEIIEAKHFEILDNLETFNINSKQDLDYAEQLKKPNS